MRIQEFIDSFQTESIKIENLFLDPNNPRLKKFFGRETQPDSVVEELQTEILKKFTNNDQEAASKEESYCNVGEIIRSITKAGYVSIDSIIVRLLKGSTDKYLVMLGNRRAAAVKKILEDKRACKEMEEAGLLGTFAEANS